MPIPMTAKQVLDREFLDIRCKILEVAAALDRLQRADGTVENDPRMASLREAVKILLSDQADRAEQVQMNFSRHYDARWREAFQLGPVRTNS